MSQNGLPPPAPGCLCQPYRSNKQKGGTVVVGDVPDVETHLRRCYSPDGYRPSSCPGCGHCTVHVHDRPERVAAGVTLMRYLCPACGATWRMLPVFLARNLWRPWAKVEAETLGPPPPATAVRVPKRTVCRWRARLASAALLLMGVLRDSAEEALVRVAAAVGEAGTRLELVLAHAAALGSDVRERLSRLAATVHRLVPGVRLM